MKKENIEKEIKDLAWNDLRTYCRDSGIDVKGKNKEDLTKAAIEMRWADILTLKQNDSNSDDIMHTNMKETDTTKIMGRMITCHVQNLNPNESKLPSKIFTIGNMKKGFELPSYIVLFNKQQQLPAVLVQHLQTEHYRTSEQKTNNEGIKVTVNVRKQAYHVTIVPTKPVKA